MSYWAVTFRLLTFNASIRYWASVYFIPHLITVVMYGASFILFKNKKRHKLEDDTKNTVKKQD